MRAVGSCVSCAMRARAAKPTTCDTGSRATFLTMRSALRCTHVTTHAATRAETPRIVEMLYDMTRDRVLEGSALKGQGLGIAHDEVVHCTCARRSPGIVRKIPF